MTCLDELSAEPASITVDHDALTMLHERFKTAVRRRRMHASNAPASPEVDVFVDGQQWATSVIKDETDDESTALLVSGTAFVDGQRMRMYARVMSWHDDWRPENRIESIWQFVPKTVVVVDDGGPEVWKSPERTTAVLQALTF